MDPCQQYYNPWTTRYCRPNVALELLCCHKLTHNKVRSVVHHSWQGWCIVRPTCLITEEAIAHGDAVTGVTCRYSTGLLLPAIKTARLPSKLGRLGNFGKAILRGLRTQTHKRVRRKKNTERHQPIKVVKSSEEPPGSYNSWNHISGLFSLCHVKVINPPPTKVDEIEQWSTSAETFASCGTLRDTAQVLQSLLRVKVLRWILIA